MVALLFNTSHAAALLVELLEYCEEYEDDSQETPDNTDCEMEEDGVTTPRKETERSAAEKGERGSTD